MQVISGDGLPFGAQLRRLWPLLHGGRAGGRMPRCALCPALATCPVCLGGPRP